MKITSKFNGRCRNCGGAILKGEQCEWERGEGVAHLGPCPAPEPKADKQPPVTFGVFRKADGRIFVVKPNREKTASYAKEIIASPARMTESGLKVDFETVYRKGAIYDLSESERWDLAEARDFLTQYARCIVCGAHLKAAKSVAAAIGPVCSKYFAHKHPEPVSPAPAPEPGAAPDVAAIKAAYGLTPEPIEDEAQVPGYFGDYPDDEARQEAIDEMRANGIYPDELVDDLPYNRFHGVAREPHLRRKGPYTPELY